MVALNKFYDYVEQESKAVHNWASHTYKAALTNTAPVATNTILADITQIAASGGYVAGGYTLDSVTLTETGGVAKVTIADEVITATGGSVGPFKYVVVYNDSATSPADALFCWYEYAGAALTLLDGESITIDFDGTSGVWTKV